MPQNKSYSELLCVFFLGFALTLLSGLPLFSHFFDSIPYHHQLNPPTPHLVEGDHLQWLYHLNLMKKAMEGIIPWLTEGYQFTTPYQHQFINPYFPPLGQMLLC